eukprot:GILK01001703.1.p1 GENE.GILK01001703.1~~GILK01001703.1.p1  ORF type:complete len:295 (-),score=43.93 GILK01001703.1:71-955(-)
MAGSLSDMSATQLEEKEQHDNESIHTSIDSEQQPVKPRLNLNYPVPSGPKHKLHNAWCFWFTKKTSGPRTKESYESNIKKVGSFDSVEDFWACYGHLIRPNDLPASSDYHLFKEGIKPMWEDPANKTGGKWMLRLKKGLASKYWEDLVLAVVGEQFDVGDQICGLVVSVRFQEDIISIWNKGAFDGEAKRKIRETMKRVLQLSETTFVEYKSHDAAIKDNSSFRHTDPHHKRFDREKTDRTPRENGAEARDSFGAATTADGETADTQHAHMEDRFADAEGHRKGSGADGGADKI